MLARLLCPLAVTTALVCLAASPAYADPSDATDVNVPTMGIDIRYVSGGHEVCADGRLKGDPPTVGGTWTFQIVGAMSNGAPINYTAGSTGTSFPRTCPVVAKALGTYGGYVATLRYVGAGDDVPAVVPGQGTWGPTGDNSSGFRI